MWAWIGVFLSASFAASLPAAVAPTYAQARGVRHHRRRRDRLRRAPAFSPIVSAAPRSPSSRWRSAAAARPASASCIGGRRGRSSPSASSGASPSSPTRRSSPRRSPSWPIPARVGTMLTLQTALGFTLTLVTIYLLPRWVDAIGWRYAFVPLVDRPRGRRVGDGAAAGAARVAAARRRAPLTAESSVWKRARRGRSIRHARGVRCRERRTVVPLTVRRGGAYDPRRRRARRWRRSQARAQREGGAYGLSPRRPSARSLQLPRAVPVLDRRGPRLRHLRHHRRLALRQGHRSTASTSPATRSR